MKKRMLLESRDREINMPELVVETAANVIPIRPMLNITSEGLLNKDIDFVSSD